MFNSPLYLCPVCKDYVELDQSKEECAKAHQCNPDLCPLSDLFPKPPISQEEQTRRIDLPTDSTEHMGE